LCDGTFWMAEKPIQNKRAFALLTKKKSLLFHCQVIDYLFEKSVRVSAIICRTEKLVLLILLSCCWQCKLTGTARFKVTNLLQNCVSRLPINYFFEHSVILCTHLKWSKELYHIFYFFVIFFTGLLIINITIRVSESKASLTKLKNSIGQYRPLKCHSYSIRIVLKNNSFKEDVTLY